MSMWVKESTVAIFAVVAVGKLGVSTVSEREREWVGAERICC